MSQTHKQKIAALLAVTLILCDLMSGSPAHLQARQKNNQTEWSEEPTPEPTEEPTAEPTEEPEPTAASQPNETPKPVKKYELVSPHAKYYKGGTKGIHYRKIKGKKVYHLYSYTTDSVKLVMSQASTFEVYGGASKKEVKKKLVTVSSSGVVKCKTKNKKIYTLLKATSKVTGESCYIYIYFNEKIKSKSGSKIKLWEKKKATVSFNYAKKKLSFEIKNKKIASVNKNGRITAKKKGTTYLFVKVKDSDKNQCRIKIVVKEEPWIVSEKDQKYDYAEMTRDLRKIARKYPGKTGLSSIGRTYDNREIWCLRVGNPSAAKKLVIDAAIHAREWKNTQVIMRQTEEILREYSEHRARFRSICLYILPMDNPDGVTISQYGASGIRNAKLRKKIQKIGHFNTWKNNARGVNINNNFPAGFSADKKKDKKKGKKRKPDATTYTGKKAASEKETKALISFIKRISPKTVLNLHSTGSILYWDFDVSSPLHEKQYRLASEIKKRNHYRMMPKSSSTEEHGGFADWLVYEKKIVSVTVETGTVPCPLPHSQYKKIYKRNKKMFRWFMLSY